MTNPPDDFQTTWSLAPLYACDDDPAIASDRESLLERHRQFVDRWAARLDEGRLEPATLAAALADYESWKRQCEGVGQEGLYLVLRLLSAGDTALAGRQAKVEDLSRRLSNETHFLVAALQGIPVEKQRELLDAPELQHARHYLERQFARGRHQLDPATERVLRLKSQPANTNWRNMTSTLLARSTDSVRDAKGRRAEVNFAQLQQLIRSRDKILRDSAGEAMHRILRTVAVAAEWEIDSLLRDRQIEDELRGFADPRDWRCLQDDVDREIVESAVSACVERFDVAHDFYRAKAKRLEAGRLRYHERWVEVGAPIQLDFQDAARLVVDTLRNVDDELAERALELFRSGRIDALPRAGKQATSFTVYYGVESPVYVFLNYTGNLRSVLTLAHEIGHALHFLEMQKHSSALDYGTTLFGAEIASSLVEQLTLERMVEEASRDVRSDLGLARLDVRVDRVFASAAIDRFEVDCHARFRERGQLDRDTLGERWQTAMSAMLGPAVETDPGSESWWVHVSSLRRSFAATSYLTGELIAQQVLALSRANAAEGSRRVDPEPIRHVLRSDLSQSPTAALEELGIDVSHPDFWRSAVSALGLGLEAL